MPRKPVSESNPIPTVFPIALRLLRIADAAHYLSCTYGFMETLMREHTVPVIVLGNRHLFDIKDLDDYIDQMKEEARAESLAAR
jgi:excisionase family DNA binding protein